MLINGQQVFNVQDASFASGSVALYSWADQDALFDTVVVSRPGSVASRRLVHPIYGRAVSAQTQLQDSLDHPERTNEEGDHDFETNSSSPQALTIGLVVALLILLGVAVGVYLWKKCPARTKGPSEDVELEVEQGDASERINVVTVRSPLHAAPSAEALDLDVQDTCDSPTSCTALKAPQSPPPLPEWPENNNNNIILPERNFRTPGASARKHPRAVPLPQPTNQPPVTYSLKKLPSSQKALAQKAPMSMPRLGRLPQLHEQQEPLSLAGSFGGIAVAPPSSAQRLPASSSKPRYPELRQRPPPRSPEPMLPSSPSPQVHTSPEIVVPSPMSVTPEPPMFPDYGLPEAPHFFSLSPPLDKATPPQRQRSETDCTENSKQWLDVSPSRTPSSHREIELSPPPPLPAAAAPSLPQYNYHHHHYHQGKKTQQQAPGLPARPPPPSFQHETWEEIRFDDESDCSDGGVEYFDDR